MAINKKALIGSSTVFKTMRNTNEIKRQLDAIQAEKFKLSPENYSSQLMIIANRLNYPSKVKVVEDFLNGRTVLVYNQDVILPSFFNVFPYKTRSDNQLHIAATANKFIGKDINDIKNVSTMYSQMQSAYIRRNMMRNFDKFTMNSKLQQYASVAYSRLCSRVMDKLFSINVDKSDSDFIGFVFAKFCLIGMMGKVDGDLTNSVAMKSVFHKSSPTTILEKEGNIKSRFPDMYEDIFKLFTAIASQYKVNIRSFIADYARMYGEASILTIDFFPAFLEMIASVHVNGYIYNEQPIKTTLNSLLDECYNAIFFII